MAQLEILSGRSAGLVLELGEGGSWDVGTSRRADLRIRDIGISYSHASLTFEGGVCTLSDARSREGTFVNGERLGQSEERPLKTGDTVTFGSTEARYTCAAPQPERTASGRIEALRTVAEEVHREEDLRDQLARTQEALAETSATLQETEAQLAETEEELSQAIEENDAARVALEELKQATLGVESDPGTQAAIEQVRDAALAREDDLSSQIARLRKKLAAISVIQSAPSADPAELEAARQKIAELEQAVVDAGKQGESNMESVFATLEALEAKIREYEATIAELEAKLAAANTEAEAARQEAEETRSQIEEINAEVIDLQDELEQLKGA